MNKRRGSAPRRFFLWGKGPCLAKKGVLCVSADAISTPILVILSGAQRSRRISSGLLRVILPGEEGGVVRSGRCYFHPHPCHPERSAAESKDLEWPIACYIAWRRRGCCAFRHRLLRGLYVGKEILRRGTGFLAQNDKWGGLCVSAPASLRTLCRERDLSTRGFAPCSR